MLWIVMEFVNEENLAETKCENLDEALEVTTELSVRLGELKNLGVIHNDIKEENIF